MAPVATFPGNVDTQWCLQDLHRPRRRQLNWEQIFTVTYSITHVRCNLSKILRTKYTYAGWMLWKWWSDFGYIIWLLTFFLSFLFWIIINRTLIQQFWLNQAYCSNVVWSCLLTGDSQIQCRVRWHIYHLRSGIWTWWFYNRSGNSDRSLQVNKSSFVDSWGGYWKKKNHDVIHVPK